MKICKKCGVSKDLDCFAKHKRTKDGYYYYCKDCNKLERKKNKDSIKKYNNYYYTQNKEKLLSDGKKYHREYYKKNRSKFLKKSEERRVENGDAFKKYHKEYYSNNKDRFIAYKIVNNNDIKKKQTEYRIKNKEFLNEKRRRRRKEDAQIGRAHV